MNSNMTSANTAEAQAFELFKLLLKSDLELADFTDPNDGNEACERVTGNAQAAADFAIGLQKVFQTAMENSSVTIKNNNFETTIDEMSYGLFTSLSKVQERLTCFTAASYFNEMISCFDDNDEEVIRWEKTIKEKQSVCSDIHLLRTSVTFRESLNEPIRKLRIAFWYR